MLIIRNDIAGNSKGAANYFDDGLAKNDYFTEQETVTGRWHGNAKNLLGLGESVKAQEFKNLVAGLDPHSGQKLTARMKKNRIPGAEFTFSCSKSISILYAMTGDERIVEAFRQSVADTMAGIEQNIETRVRKNGRNFDRKTGNMVWAEFLHKTSRPVNGVPCPQLHIHAYAPNITFCDIEKRFKATKIRNVKSNGETHQNEFMRRLSGSMEALGYEIDRNGKWFDISGISRQIIDKYSLRTAQIDQVAKDRGISDADKVELGSRTREAKTTDFSMNELKENWKNRLSPDEARQVQRVIEAANNGDSSGFTFVQDDKEPKHPSFWDFPLKERFEIIDQIDRMKAEYKDKLDEEAQQQPDKKAERFEHIGTLGAISHEKDLR